MKRLQVIAVAVVVSMIGGGPAEAQRRGGPERPADFGFRFLGPVVGNRVAAFAAAPGDHATYYAGAASGGVFKTTDGGQRWAPVFDDQPVAAIGALAVSASKPNTVWAGTGEAWAIRDIDVTGDGIYKSTDAGKTWTNMGLRETGRIGRVLVNPNDDNDVWVCALGRLPAPQPERGVYHTADGGKTWTRSLFVDANTGCSGLSMDAKNPRVVYAGTWQVKMNTWGEFSGGPGSGVYKTSDGGAHWTKAISSGLPKSPLGKIDVAVAPSDSSRVYALIQTNGQGSLWRSDDAGGNWRVVNWDRRLIGRAGYYIHIAVSPADADRIIVTNSSVLQSTDGGVTITQAPWGGDTHDIWWDPKDPKHFAVTNDGGVYVTSLGGDGGQRFTLPIGGMYHVEVDNQVPYFIYTNMQDNSTMRGPSIPIGGRPSDEGWDHHMGGCESGFTLPDPSDPNIVWASCYANEVTRWDARTKTARSVSPWFHTLDAAPDEVPYRCHWTPPLAIDPFDPKSVYYGCQVVWKTTDSGQSWKVVSPDLSHRDPKYIKPSGGIVGDNLGQFAPEVVFAIAPSKIRQGLVWAGTNDGKVWYSSNGGGAWNDVTAGLKGMMPELGTVTSIEPSHFDPATAYMTVDAHLIDNRDPFVFKTTDTGRTWTKISNNLPAGGPLTYVRNVSEDPNVKGLLFLGTGNDLYYSLNDSGTWTRLHTGLPSSPVTWTVVQKNFHDLVVSTYGRGIYILDDISPLEQIATAGQPSAPTFFKPRDTYRLTDGHAYFTYWLPAAMPGGAKVEIVDAAGNPIRTLNGSAHEGMNRVPWDLHYDNFRTIQLRTIPPENPNIWDDTRFKGHEWRPVTHWGMPPSVPGPMAAPGGYQVRITVGDRTMTQSLTLIRNPKAQATNDELKTALAMQLELREMVGKMSAMVNLIERQRHQLEELRASGDKSIPEKTIATIDQKLQDVEYSMLTKDLAASDDKYYISAYKTYFAALWLNGEIGSGAGDVAGGGDQKPTDTSHVLVAELQKQLVGETALYQSVQARDVPAFNRVLAAKGKAPLVTVLPADASDAEYANQANFFDADADDADTE